MMESSSCFCIKKTLILSRDRSVVSKTSHVICGFVFVEGQSHSVSDTVNVSKIHQKNVKSIKYD